MRLTVIIPAWQAENTLAATLACLQDADEIIVVDGGSTDRTLAIARSCGARAIVAPKGRGPQMNAGAVASRGDWLLFLHADTRLGLGWRASADAWMASPGAQRQAAVFRFALDDAVWQARIIEWLVALRIRLFGLAYGDQGLLIHRQFLTDLGLFRPIAMLEDVDAARRIGKWRLHVLPVAALTSARRWREDGWARRSLRNLLCVALFRLGVPVSTIAAIYEA
jgi:rSAM/selenodomain-associated transferase 2